MGGERALGVALVMECWLAERRPLLAGVIGAASNFGFLSISLVGVAFPITVHSWRWMMLAGAGPALLAMLIMLYVPESQRWRQSVARGPSRPLAEIFSPPLLRSTLLAVAFASIALIGTWGAVSALLPVWVDQLAYGNPYAKATTQAVASVGSILGCFLGALIGGRFGRRPAYFAFCLASLVSTAFLFRCLTEYNALFLATAGVVGFSAATFYGWLPLYLPELFPTRARATGQGLSFNFGRIFAALGALGSGQLVAAFHGDYGRACATITLVYVLGLVLIWLAPETKGKPLPE
jgi:MFS family permease